MDDLFAINDLELYISGIMLDDKHEERDIAISYNNCPSCKIPMTVKSDNQYVCPNCGMLNEHIAVVDMNTTETNMNYNTISSGLRCIGSNSHRYQTILRSHSNDGASPELHVRNILFSFNCKIGKDGAPPKNILLNVCEQFKHMRMEGTIYRGTILRAILAAMTYYECLRHKLPFKPIDIYQWFDVDSQTYSKGDKKVREMLDHGFLMEDIREINAEYSYLHAYSAKLNLDEDKVKFLEELMDYVSDNNLLNPNAKSTTRALCILHIFLVSIQHPIKPDEFKIMFKCNYGTIRTISLNLFHVKEKLIPIFKKYDIPIRHLEYQSEKTKKIVNKRRIRTGRIVLE